MRVSEAIVSALQAEGIHHVFVVPGQAIDPLMDSLSCAPDIKTIICAHEAGAAFMADGYSRASGRIGVCLTTSGPGFTNTLTPLATAFADRVSVLVISGEVSHRQEGRGALQDSSAAGIDTHVMAMPVTVRQLSLSAPEQLYHHLHQLFASMSGPATRGPTHLVIPVDFQSQQIDGSWHAVAPGLCAPRLVDTEQTGQCLSRLNQHERIVILAGAGCAEAGAGDALRQFAEQFSIPVATTLHAKGIFPETHPLSLGGFGWYGNLPAIDAMTGGETRTLLVLGSRLNMLDTLGWHDAFSRFDSLIVNDINPHLVSSVWPVDVFVTGDCLTFLQYLNRSSSLELKHLAATVGIRRHWVQTMKRGGMSHAFTASPSPVHPATVALALQKTAPPDARVFTDSGAHAFFIGHYLLMNSPGRFFSAVRTTGPMGWAIPAAIGAALACPSAPCIAVTGDGCMLMHGTEIQTAARYQVPVIFVVMNNRALGNPQLRARRNNPVLAAEYALPQHDWAMFACALGVQGYTVNHADELESVLATAFARRETALIDIRTGNVPTPTGAFDNHFSRMQTPSGTP